MRLTRVVEPAQHPSSVQSTQTAPHEEGLAESKDEKPDDKAVDQLVGALGLPELILGSLALYALRRHMVPADLSREFPATGFPWVDVALLGCAAAVFGKVVTLTASGLIALFYWRSQRTDRLKYWIRLRTAVDSYRARQGLPPFTTTKGSELETPREQAKDKAHSETEKQAQQDPKKASDRIPGLRDLAVAYIALEQPQWAKALLNSERSALLAYGSALVGILYIPPILKAGDALVVGLMFVSFPTAIAFGMLYQLVVIEQAGIEIEALAARPQEKRQGGHEA